MHIIVDELLLPAENDSVVIYYLYDDENQWRMRNMSVRYSIISEIII